MELLVNGHLHSPNYYGLLSTLYIIDPFMYGLIIYSDLWAKLHCAGNIIPDVVPYLYWASLLACTKKGGGVQSVAVGEVLHRLTSRCISRAVQNESAEILTLLQLGIRVLGTYEAIVYSDIFAGRCWIQWKDKWTLQLDSSNAFNSISHGIMFKEIRDWIPSLAAWLEAAMDRSPCFTLEIRLYPVVVDSKKGSSWSFGFCFCSLSNHGED